LIGRRTASSPSARSPKDARSSDRVRRPLDQDGSATTNRSRPSLS
jgi:hypothetical protein